MPRLIEQVRAQDEALHARERIVELEQQVRALRDIGIPCLLDCPKCGEPHIDRPQPEKGWTNPPHRTHECQNCWHLWRPFEVATYGIENPLAEKHRAELESLSADERQVSHAYAAVTQAIAGKPVDDWFLQHNGFVLGAQELHAQIAQLRAELAEAKAEVERLNKCSYIGPMRDCPTHGESAELAGLRAELAEARTALARLTK